MSVDLKAIFAAVEKPPKKTRYGEGYLYMVHSSSGVGKVGFTKNPEPRLRALVREFREHGMECDAVKITRHLSNGRGLEYAAILLLAEKYECFKGREFFKCPSADDFWAHGVQAAIDSEKARWEKYRQEARAKEAKIKINRLMRARPQRVMDIIATTLVAERAEAA